jgi:hypothetical protein
VSKVLSASHCCVEYDISIPTVKKSFNIEFIIFSKIFNASLEESAAII